jgi:hypothetical protein
MDLRLLMLYTAGAIVATTGAQISWARRNKEEILARPGRATLFAWISAGLVGVAFALIIAFIVMWRVG